MTLSPRAARYARWMALALACALILRFAWHSTIATIGDDSVSYLVLAQYFAGTADAYVREWAAFHPSFMPLFPLVLAATGASTDLLAAHLVVALFAVAALAMLYRYAALQMQSRAAGLALAAAFMLTPTAWIGVLGILSEPQYLFLSLAALHFHATRLESARAAPAQWLAFGLLMALAYLTRASGIALIAAFVVHAVVRAIAGRDTPRWHYLLPLVPVVLLAGAWLALRPVVQGENHGIVLGTIVELLRHDPLRLMSLGANSLAAGWIASFAAESDVHWVAKAVCFALAAMALAGAALRARRNRLDGWYALASLAILFVWFFREDVVRRLLYPLVPVLIVHAAYFVSRVAARLRSGLPRRALVLVALLPPVAICLPAVVLVQSKSMDRAPAIAGFAPSYASITEYYTSIRVHGSRSVAARHIAVIVGLGALRTDTPPGAKVMWMRPDYVALLGGRQGVAWYYRQGTVGLARELQRTGTEYLVVTTLYKNDMLGIQDDPVDTIEAVSAFSQPVSVVRNAVLGTSEFALMKVDPAALAAYLAAH